MLNNTDTHSPTMMMLAASLVAATGCVMDDAEPALEHDWQAVILPNVILPNVILPNVILPNVILPNGAGTADFTFQGLSFNPATSVGLSVAGLGIDAVALDGLVVNGAGENALTVAGQPLSADQEQAFKLLATYLVQCSLSTTQSVTIIASNGSENVLQGALGLAPEWATGALTDVGRRYVSACIAARSNANGQPVLISLRGGDIAISATEKGAFQHVEGAFFGNVFGTDQHMSTCSALGGGIAGRDCTDGACYFEDTGSCATVCDTQSNTDGSFAGCAGQTAVITTALPATRRRSFIGAHSCSIDAAGSLTCVGANEYGQLGNGTTDDTDAASATAVDFGDGATVAEVVSGSYHTCARLADGVVSCFGKNTDGQAGNGSTTANLLAPSADALITDAMSVRSGSDHVCALEADGTVLCWGKNKDGQLGDGSHGKSNVPVVADLGAQAIRIATGNLADHTCAITIAGTMECWGDNNAGQLGDGTQRDSSTPVAIAGLDNLVDVCTGKAFTCALDAHGLVSCTGTINSAQTHVQMTLSQPATGISCAANSACATLADGTQQCF